MDSTQCWPLKSAFPVRVRLRRRTACRITRAWGTKESIHLTGTATVPRPKAWLVMKLLPNPAKTPVAEQCRERRLGQVGFAHHTFRFCPPSHHTVRDVMKPCFDAVKQKHSDATMFLKGLSRSSRQFLTSTICLMLSKSSPGETCCFQKRSLLFKQPIFAVYMPALHATDTKSRVHTYPKLAEHPCCKLQLLG